MELYAEGQLTTRKSTVLETYFGYVPIVMDNVTILTGQILSPMNPTSGASHTHKWSPHSYEIPPPLLQYYMALESIIVGAQHVLYTTL